MDSFVDLKVAGSTSVQAFVDTVKECGVLPSEGRIFILDGKCLTVNSKGVSCGLPLQMLRAVFQLLFSTSDAEPGIFGEKDMLLVFDGHNSKVDTQIKRELAKLLKSHPSICRRKGVVTMRLMSHNREFRSPDHVLGPQRKRAGGLQIHASLPDPLENLTIVRCRSMPLPCRERKFLDLPGDSSCRGIANLQLGCSFRVR